MRKRKVKVFEYDTPPYPAILSVIVGDTIQDANSKMDELTKGQGVKGELSALGCTSDRRTKKGTQIVYVLLPRGTKEYVIAHEAVHVVNFIYTQKGVMWDLENDEPHAYFLSQVVTQITHAVKNAR